MLTTTYKIVSKILAERLKPKLPKLVDQQQTRFITGQCISNNLFAYRLRVELVEEMGQDMIFLKLDFEKAYDRVDHRFVGNP